MANNCLVTKLKGIVDNNLLPKLGTINIKVNYSADNVKNISQLILVSRGDSVINTTDSGYYGFNWENLDSVHQSEGNTPTENTPIFLKNDNFYLQVTNKYNLRSIRMEDSSYAQRIKVNLADLEYCGILDTTILYSPNGDINSLALVPNLVVCIIKDTMGNIDALAGLSKLRELTLWGNITGSLTSLGSITTLESVNFDTAAVDIEIQDFVNAQNGAGRVTKNTPFTIYSNKVYFGGLYSGYSYNWVTWNGTSKITVYCASSGTYTNAPKIMAKGATAEEIAAWEQAGKTVVVVP